MATVTRMTPTAQRLHDARQIGIVDAKRGLLCVPEMYFVRRGQQIAYAQGYESVAGVTLSSSQFTHNEVSA